MPTQQKEESSFRAIPFWTQLSATGRRLLARREARKRAVIRLIDSLKSGVKPGGRLRA